MVELPLDPPRAPPAENHPPAPLEALRTGSATLAPPEVAGAAPPVLTCEGCGGELSEVQRARGARHCRPGCRVRAHRQRTKGRRLAEIDAAIRVLVALRAEIERG